jgi:Zn-dependent peptidase ImmA (M78 family)
MNIQVNGNTLSSLRKRYKATLKQASHITGIDEEKLTDWETHGTEMSLTQAKNYAKKFNAHWSVLLLKTDVKPIKEAINHRAGYSDNTNFSMLTMRAYENARRLLNASIEINGQTVDGRIKKLCLASNADAKQCASDARSLLGITPEVMKTVRGGPVEVYKFWVNVLSSVGIYVSEQNMPEEETKAFLLEDNSRAVIVINKNDRYPHSKVFSLLHELGHIVRGETSAACSATISAKRIDPAEKWCNQFASEMIVPDTILMADPIVNTIKTSSEPSGLIKILSTKYRASFTVIMFKLLQHKKISDVQYKEMQTFFDMVLLPKFKIKVDKDKEIKLGKAYHVNIDVKRASQSLSREVLAKHMSGALSYSQVAKLLGTKARYIEDIKSAVGFGQ